MTNPLLNVWFLLGIILAIVSITIRASTDKSRDINVWNTGLNYAVATAIMALVSLIIGIVQITP